MDEKQKLKIRQDFVFRYMKDIINSMEAMKYHMNKKQDLKQRQENVIICTRAVVAGLVAILTVLDLYGVTEMKKIAMEISKGVKKQEAIKKDLKKAIKEAKHKTKH